MSNISYATLTIPQVSDASTAFSIKPIPYPYDRYISGRVFIHRELNRRYIQLYGSNGEKFSTAYARYLMSVKLGYIIPDDVTIDHINNNALDDRIENLQPLTQTQNSKKAASVTGKHQILFLCPVCQQKTITPFHKTHFHKKHLTVSFCSARCAAKFNGSDLTKDEAVWIGQNQALYEIRTHWFEYEDYYCDFYPHTKILRYLSRELLSEDSSRCRDIPNLTEFCWDIFTPEEERGKKIIELAKEGHTTRQMSAILGMDRKLIAQYIKQTRPDLLKSPRANELIPVFKNMIQKGMTIEEMAQEVDMTKLQAYTFVRSNRLGDPGKMVSAYKEFYKKIDRIKEYKKQNLKLASMARKEETGYTNFHQFYYKYLDLINDVPNAKHPLRFT